jgi:hypothetical protein
MISILKDTVRSVGDEVLDLIEGRGRTYHEGYAEVAFFSRSSSFLYE